MLSLKRGSEYRYLRIGRGFHRTVVMAALGYETVPATFQQPFVSNLDNVDYWPQVRRGVGTREDAIRYFHHLFDWASDRGLLLEQQHKFDLIKN